MPYKKGTDVQLTGDMDMQQHQLLNPVISNLASNPLKPKSGQIYFNTVTNKKRTFNGTTWDEDGTGGGPGTGDLTYVHNQPTAASLWTINHGLGKFPSVSVVDSANNVVIGDVTYVTDHQVTISFGSSFGGKAYCN